MYQQLVFDPSDSTKVIGVKYLRQNNTEPKFAYARKEVILSAGAINSPVLMMQSGIGPRKDLEALKVSHHDLLFVHSYGT